MRGGPSRGRRLVANSLGVILITAVVAAAVFVLRISDEDSESTVVVSPGVPGLSVTVGSQSLYPAGDPWSAYLAPESACPGGGTRSASVRAQRQTMICLVNWARERRGLRPLSEQPLLSRAAALTGRDVPRCSDFAHEACGKAPNEVATEAGYDPAGWGENLYLGPEWTEQGVALVEVPLFEGQPDVAIWVSHFGRR